MARHAYTLGHIEVFEVVGKRDTYHVAIDLNDKTVECDCACGYFRKSPWRIRDTRLCRHAKEALLHLFNMNYTPGIIDLYHGDPVGPSGFHQMKDAGVLAVIHKATDGMKYIDSEYDHREKRARAVGLLWGAYHFMQNGNGVDQCKRFLDVVQPASDTLLAVDWETPLAGRKPATLAQVNDFARTLIEECGGGLLYSGWSFLNDARVTPDMSIAKLHLWGARYAPGFGKVPHGWSDWLVWQNTSSGRVPGVIGSVDLDLFHGSKEHLLKHWPFRTTT